MQQIGWAERQVRRADSFQQRHIAIAFPWAVLQKFGNDHRLVFIRLATMEVRRPEVEVTTSFTDAADEDPLRDGPSP
jgi:hypothetical protein